MVETDVRRCADGSLVLSHDPHLGGVSVQSSDWKTLSGIDLGGGNHPVTLDGALAAFPGKRWNLEVKNLPSEEGFEPDLRIALETAEKAGAGDLLSSFYWPNMDAVKASFPHVATALLLSEGWEIETAAAHASANGHVAIVPHWSSLVPDPAVIGRLADRGVGVVSWTVNDPEVAAVLVEHGLRGIITDDPGLMKEVFG